MELSHKNVKMFGENCLFKQLEEEIRGSLILPANLQKQYELGKILVVGDGITKNDKGEKKTTPAFVKEGDFIWFQVNKMMAINNVVKIKEELYMTINWNDMIARLSSTEVKLENFEILGWWILLESFHINKSEVALPEDYEPPIERMRYKVLQKGCLTGNDFNVGDELLIDKGRANPVTINRKQYYYIDSRFVKGIIQSDNPDEDYKQGAPIMISTDILMKIKNSGN